jgi:phosphatidate cytidylyltransferase
MTYPEASEPDDRPADGRRTQSARPAWDAATYGVPEDLRRSIPSRGRARRHADDWDQPPAPPRPEPYPTTDPYRPADPYPQIDAYPQPEPYRTRDPYRAAEPYPASESQPAPYEAYAAPSRHRDPVYPPAEPRPVADDYRAAAEPVAAPDAFATAPTGEYPSQEHTYAGFESFAAPFSDERYPASYPEENSNPAEEPAPKRRAGRNLRAAIGVGVGLGAVVIGTLFVWRPAFLALIVLAVAVGVWELVRAVRTTGVNPPLVPLVVGGAMMAGFGWFGKVDALTFGLVVTVLAAMVWRLADGPPGYLRDVSAATLIAVYVPFLAGFAALLASPADGAKRVIVTLICVVLSDTGGYVAGVFWGKHRMAPSISPKKSWEGLAGSLVATAIGAAIALAILFDVAPGWGLLFGLGVSAACVLGDLAESMVKRDLGIKDMSNLLPGHGGVMDRLDSIVFAVPTAYAFFLLVAPAT